MAIGYPFQHWPFQHRPLPVHRTDAHGHSDWRPIVLIVLAVLAAALATYSLLIHPSDSPPAHSTYLPPPSH